MLALAARPAGDGGYWLQEITESGERAGSTMVIESPAALTAWAEAGYRWLWDATSVVYPALVRAGIRVERCHDITLTERILLAREGAFGVPSAAAAAYARATGGDVPDDPTRDAPLEHPTLFEPSDTPSAGSSQSIRWTCCWVPSSISDGGSPRIGR